MDATTNPLLTVSVHSTRNLGRCYNETVYKVTSTRPLSSSDIRSLRTTRFLGYGQEFSFVEVLPDGSKVFVPDEASYARRQPTYIYECTDRVDSSD